MTDFFSQKIMPTTFLSEIFLTLYKDFGKHLDRSSNTICQMVELDVNSGQLKINNKKCIWKCCCTCVILHFCRRKFHAKFFQLLSRFERKAEKRRFLRLINGFRTIDELWIICFNVKFLKAWELYFWYKNISSDCKRLDLRRKTFFLFLNEPLKKLSPETRTFDSKY